MSQKFNRRSFLKSSFALAAVGVGAISIPSTAKAMVGNGLDCSLRLARVVNGRPEYVVAQYITNGELHIPGYVQICHILRDTHERPEKQVVQMNIKLLNLLFTLQGWLRQNNLNDLVWINSGYRSVETNRKTKGAREGSFHVYGMAVDIVVPSLNILQLGNLGRMLKAGGVGYYFHDGFVHLDVGPVGRVWVER